KTLDAKLVSIDLKSAEAMSGVVAVRDGNFVGVAAPSTHEAEQAIKQIKVEWSPTTFQSSSQSLFADLKRSGRGADAVDNELEAALQSADHKLEAAYTIAYLAHAPLEPRAAVAQWQDGKLTVWTGTQQPFGVRSSLAQAFGLSEDNVRVIVPETGSGYGG